jgi:hypothetical protein
VYPFRPLKPGRMSDDALSSIFFLYIKITGVCKKHYESKLEYCSIGHVFDSHLVLGLGPH